MSFGDTTEYLSSKVGTYKIPKVAVVGGVEVGEAVESWLLGGLLGTPECRRWNTLYNTMFRRSLLLHINARHGYECCLFLVHM